MAFACRVLLVHSVLSVRVLLVTCLSLSSRCCASLGFAPLGRSWSGDAAWGFVLFYLPAGRGPLGDPGAIPFDFAVTDEPSFWRRLGGCGWSDRALVSAGFPPFVSPATFPVPCLCSCVLSVCASLVGEDGLDMQGQGVGQRVQRDGMHACL